MNDKEEMKKFLKELIALPGISGYEEPVRNRIEREWKPLTDQIFVSKIGNLYGLKKGCGSGKKILLATHMDGIGMIIQRIADEMLYFAPVGGFDPRILPGQFVTIHTKRGDIPGLIVQPPSFLLSHSESKEPVPMDELAIDTGFTAKEVKEMVQIGDTVSYATIPTDMETDCVAGHSLDNRTSITALTECLKELQHIKHEWDVYAVSTVQEEVSYLGGHTAPYDIRPDAAIAIDVTFASGPGASGWKVKPLESGPALGYGANIHPAFYKAFKNLAEELAIPYTNDPMPGMSGTDGCPIQVTMNGIPTMVISIPLRYMHTPVEVISMKDVMLTGHLMAEFIARMDDSFMQKMVWED